MATKDPYRYFRVEARDLVEQLGRGILELEKGASDPPVVSRLLRLAHTLNQIDALRTLLSSSITH